MMTMHKTKSVFVTSFITKSLDLVSSTGVHTVYIVTTVVLNLFKSQVRW